MNNTITTSLLDILTNMLAGLFILFVLVAIKVGSGGTHDVPNIDDGATEYLSSLRYKTQRKKKEWSEMTAYIEIYGPKAKQLELSLLGAPITLKNCSIGKSVSKSNNIWTVRRPIPIKENWQLIVQNPQIINKPISVRIHILSGNVHSCTSTFEISKTDKVLTYFNEIGENLPSIIFNNNESCL